MSIIRRPWLVSETYHVNVPERDIVALQKSGIAAELPKIMAQALLGSEVEILNKDTIRLTAPYDRDNDRSADGPRSLMNALNKAIEDAYDLLILHVA